MRQKHVLYFCLSLLFVTVLSFWLEGQGRFLSPPTSDKVSPTQGPSSSLKKATGNQSIQNFYQAKKQTAIIYQGFEATFYCGCSYRDSLVNHKSCGYKPQEDNVRAFRIEWEHIVPAADFGRSFVAWRQGDPRCQTKAGKPYKGRRCARLTSPQFNAMEADLYNLAPAIGEVNSRRSSLPMVLDVKDPTRFGRCETVIGTHGIAPREAIRGFIARTYLYMHASYPGHGIISRKNKKLFESWDRLYPADKAERIRATRIMQIQGNSNPYVNQAGN